MSKLDKEFTRMEVQLAKLKGEYAKLRALERRAPKRIPTGLATLTIEEKSGAAIHSFPNLTPTAFVELRRHMYRVLVTKLKRPVKFKRTVEFKGA